MKTEHQTNHETPPVFEPVRELNIKGEKFIVRELPWTQALKFAKLLVDASKAFAKEDNQFEFSMDKLPELVLKAEELSTFLIMASAGLDQKQLDAIAFSDACEILDMALAINLSPEVLGKAKKAAGRFAQAIGVDVAALAKKKPSPDASTS